MFRDQGDPGARRGLPDDQNIAMPESSAPEEPICHPWGYERTDTRVSERPGDDPDRETNGNQEGRDIGDDAKRAPQPRRSTRGVNPIYRKK